MVSFYILESSKFIDKFTEYLNIKYTNPNIIKYPENGLSPWEQIDWINKHHIEDAHIITYSPYIMNYLNVLINKGALNKTNLSAYWVHRLDIIQPLLGENEKGKLVVDTFSLSEPMYYIYQELK